LPISSATAANSSASKPTPRKTSSTNRSDN
jgi:hypothetical protein